MKKLYDVLGNGVMYFLTFLQTNELLETISLCLSIFISAFILITSVVEWWKKAKNDGKITAEEIQEGAKVVIDGASEIKTQIEQLQGEENANQ